MKVSSRSNNDEIRKGLLDSHFQSFISYQTGHIFGLRLAVLLPLLIAAVFFGFFLELVTVEKLNLLSRFPIIIKRHGSFASLSYGENLRPKNPDYHFSSLELRSETVGNVVDIESNILIWMRRRFFNISNFRWIRNNESLCRATEGHENSLVLPILVHTARSHFTERMAIRKSWGSLLHYKNWSLRLVFLLGEADRGLDISRNWREFNEQEEMLDREESYFGDLVEGSFVDSYKNLTYKHMMGYKWILNFCSNAEFVLKVDDDMFIDIIQFLQWRSEDIKRKLEMKGKQEPFPDLYCSTFVGTKPQRCVGCKWYTSEAEWELDYYPDYCSGWCYGLTVDLIRKLYTTLDQIKFFWIDDVFATGVLMEEVKKKYHGFEPVYKHLWGHVRSLDFKNYRPICERHDMSMKRRFGVVVPVARGSNFERDMACLWNKTVYDDGIAHKNHANDESVEVLNCKAEEC